MKRKREPVELEVDRMEQLAIKLHDLWWKTEPEKGRVLGPERTKATHPHLERPANIAVDVRDADRDAWSRLRASEVYS